MTRASDTRWRATAAALFLFLAAAIPAGASEPTEEFFADYYGTSTGDSVPPAESFYVASGGITWMGQPIFSPSDTKREEVATGTIKDRLVYGQGWLDGLRFVNVIAPRSTKIHRAGVLVVPRRGRKRAITVEYRAEATGNSAPVPAFEPPLFNLSSRPTTTASVTETPAAWEADQYNGSPDLRAILQEVVNRTDWKATNALSILVRDKGSPARRKPWWGGTATPPYLVYAYEEPLRVGPALPLGLAWMSWGPVLDPKLAAERSFPSSPEITRHYRPIDAWHLAPDGAVIKAAGYKPASTSAFFDPEWSASGFFVYSGPDPAGLGDATGRSIFLSDFQTFPHRTLAAGFGAKLLRDNDRVLFLRARPGIPGSVLTYDGYPDLHLISIGARTERRLLPANPQVAVRNPLLSPDEGMIAFTGLKPWVLNTNDDPALYGKWVYNPETRIYDFVTSPDGIRDYGAYLLDVATGRTEFFRETAPGGGPVGWSPDGTKVAIQSLYGSPRGVGVLDRATWRLSWPAPESYRTVDKFLNFAGWLPDSRRILVRVRDRVGSEDQRYFILDTAAGTLSDPPWSGPVAQSFGPYFRVFSASWSPDGKWLLIWAMWRATSGTAPRSDLILLPLDGRPAINLTANYDASQQAVDCDWSPDGKWLAVAVNTALVQVNYAQHEAYRYYSEILAVPLEGGAPINVTAGKPGKEKFSPRWTPAAKRFPKGTVGYD